MLGLEASAAMLGRESPASQMVAPVNRMKDGESLVCDVIDHRVSVGALFLRVGGRRSIVTPCNQRLQVTSRLSDSTYSADFRDSKSGGVTPVWVQVPPSVLAIASESHTAGSPPVIELHQRHNPAGLDDDDRHRAASSSGSLWVIRTPLKMAIFPTHGKSGRQSWEIGVKSQNSELSRPRQR